MNDVCLKQAFFSFLFSFLPFFFFFFDVADKVENEQGAGCASEVTEWGTDTL